MQVFWSRGYEATSLADLTRSMGLSKSSLYDTFGSKHDLFLEVIDYYRENVSSQIRSIIGIDAPTRQVIANVLGRAVDRILDPVGKRGCLLNNTAVELGPNDPEAAARCGRPVGRRGDIPSLADPRPGQGRNNRRQGYSRFGTVLHQHHQRHHGDGEGRSRPSKVGGHRADGAGGAGLVSLCYRPLGPRIGWSQGPVNAAEAARRLPAATLGYARGSGCVVGARIFRLSRRRP